MTHILLGNARKKSAPPPPPGLVFATLCSGAWNTQVTSKQMDAFFTWVFAFSAPFWLVILQ
jgi:hypothetical protein